MSGVTAWRGPKVSANKPMTKFLIALAIFALLFCSACFSSYDPESTDHLQPAVYSASFSPTEASIVFTMFNYDCGGIFLMDYQGRVLQWLVRTTGPLRLASPVFSPDGKKIAFVSSSKESHGDLYLMDRDGQNLVQLTSGPDHDRQPCFSSNGRTIYFLRHDRGGIYPVFDQRSSWHGDVYQVGVHTKQVRRVTHQDYYRLWTLAVFPDNRHLLLGTTHYQTRTAETGHDLWKVDSRDPGKAWPVEPNLKPFAPDPRSHFVGPPFYIQIHSPTLSRDGRFLAFAWSNPLPGKSSCLFPCDQTFLTELADRRTEKLTALPAGSDPQDISPDNRLVLVSNQAQMKESPKGVFSRSNLWMVKRDGTGLKNLKLDFRGVLDKPPTPVRLP